eukprot:gene4073-5048_t
MLDNRIWMSLVLFGLSYALGGHAVEFPPCNVTTEVVDHTFAAIRNATLETRPYPTIYIEQIFEPAFYACILGNIPRPNLTKRVYNSPPGRGAGRYRIKLRGGSGPYVHTEVSSLKPQDAKHINEPFWTAFARSFGSKAIQTLWLSKFQISVVKRKWTDSIRAEMYYFMELNRDLSGYAIGVVPNPKILPSQVLDTRLCNALFEEYLAFLNPARTSYHP